MPGPLGPDSLPGKMLFHGRPQRVLVKGLLKDIADTGFMGGVVVLAVVLGSDHEDGHLFFGKPLSHGQGRFHTIDFRQIDIPGSSTPVFGKNRIRIDRWSGIQPRRLAWM